MNTQLPCHSKISPTALLVAWLRTLSNIPYSKEISLAANAATVFREIAGEDRKAFFWMAPLLELRHNSLSFSADLFPNHQRIVELASGVSPRGMIKSQDQRCSYLETDLHDILVRKQRIVSDILAGGVRNNLDWLPVNVLCPADFGFISERVGSEQVTVINEGLLPYLTHEEQAQVAENIRWLLGKHGGVWITPDLMGGNGKIREMMTQNPDIARISGIFSKLTGRDLSKNQFGSEADAEEFYRDLGFTVTRERQFALTPHLSSLPKIKAPKGLFSVLEDAGIWTLRARR